MAPWKSYSYYLEKMKYIYFESFTVATTTWLTVMEYLCHKWPRICSTWRKHFLLLSSFIHITGFGTRLTRRVSLVEQELLTLPEHLSSPPVFSGFRVTRSLVLYICFVDSCLSFCTFSFGHCVVRYTDFDCHFGICKLFLLVCQNMNLIATSSLIL
jgi:hypothetical protein